MHTYKWDGRRNLVAIDNGATASFIYDPAGRRISKTVFGITTSYLYDGANIVQELTGGSPSANLLTGGVDEVFARTDSSGSRNFLLDGMYNTAALTDSCGTIQTQYTYEPYGATSTSGNSSTNSFDFTGREADATNLYYYRARYYNPATQRFLSEDPIGFGGGSPNLYTYSFNSPTNYVDPSGNDAATDLAAFGTFVGLSQLIPGWDVVLDAGLLAGAAALTAYAANDAINQGSDAANPVSDTTSPDSGRKHEPEGDRACNGPGTFPDDFFNSKAPYQVEPGTGTLSGQHINDLGRVEPWTAYYDEYGRLIARTDYNAGNAAEGIPDVHYHTYEWGPGKNPLETGSHIPGEYPCQ